MLLWRGWRYLLRPAVLICNMVCSAPSVCATPSRSSASRATSRPSRSTRPYVGLIFDVIGAWRVYGTLIAVPQRLAWTIFALVAVIVALIAIKPVRLAADCD